MAFVHYRLFKTFRVHLNSMFRDAIGWAIAIVVVASLAKFFITMLVYLFH